MPTSRDSTIFHMSIPNLWFALASKPRHEKAIDQILRSKGLESYLPLYRARHHWSDRVKSVDLPLFPGYLFCRFDYRQRVPVLSTPGVLSIVGFAGVPTPVSEEEIAAIQGILASGLPSGPWPYIRIGQTVRIERGSLAGLQGVLVREKDAMRVVVSVELLRRAVAVEISRDMIAAASNAWCPAERHLNN
jgi:transcription antitermination factor NusG